jgi:DNA-binding XRE family transcriptional regulator
MFAAYAANMTIAEHLQFSVLSAPIAALDRRALSEAWYSTLYKQQRGQPMDPHAAHRSPVNVTVLQTAKPSAALGDPRHARHDTRVALRGVQRSAINQTEVERRSARLPLARKIERTFARPRKPLHAAAFVIEGTRGRVQVILQSRGTRLNLVAICSPTARAHVARALEQARYSLAVRGIELQTDTLVHVS